MLVLICVVLALALIMLFLLFCFWLLLLLIYVVWLLGHSLGLGTMMHVQSFASLGQSNQRDDRQDVSQLLYLSGLVELLEIRFSLISIKITCLQNSPVLFGITQKTWCSFNTLPTVFFDSKLASGFRFAYKINSQQFLVKERHNNHLLSRLGARMVCVLWTLHCGFVYTVFLVVFLLVSCYHSLVIPDHSLVTSGRAVLISHLNFKLTVFLVVVPFNLLFNNVWRRFPPCWRV